MDDLIIPSFGQDIKSALLRLYSPTVIQALFGSLLTLFTLSLTTYIFTTCRFYLTSRASSRFMGKEPPTLSYWIPWVGNGLSMVRDPHKFYEETL